MGRDLLSVPVLSIANNSSLSGVYKHTLAFLASACLAILATLFTLTAAALWTTAINTSESVNGLILNTTNIPLGIEVSSGSGLSLLWAAVGLLIASLIPYLIRSDSRFRLAPTKRLTWFFCLSTAAVPSEVRRLQPYLQCISVLILFVHPMMRTYHHELCLKHANDLTYDLGTLMEIRHRYLPRPRRMYKCKCNNYLPTPAMGFVARSKGSWELLRMRRPVNIFLPTLID